VKFVATDYRGRQLTGGEVTVWGIPFAGDSRAAPSSAILIEPPPSGAVHLSQLSELLDDLGARIFFGDGSGESAELTAETAWSRLAAARFALDCAGHVALALPPALPRLPTLLETLSQARELVDVDPHTDDEVEMSAKVWFRRALASLQDLADIVLELAISGEDESGSYAGELDGEAESGSYAGELDGEDESGGYAGELGGERYELAAEGGEGDYESDESPQPGAGGTDAESLGDAIWLTTDATLRAVNTAIEAARHGVQPHKVETLEKRYSDQLHLGDLPEEDDGDWYSPYWLGAATTAAVAREAAENISGAGERERDWQLMCLSCHLNGEPANGEAFAALWRFGVSTSL
jgi:hypothetical protein